MLDFLHHNADLLQNLAALVAIATAVLLCVRKAIQFLMPRPNHVPQPQPITVENAGGNRIEISGGTVRDINLASPVPKIAEVKVVSAKVFKEQQKSDTFSSRIEIILKNSGDKTVVLQRGKIEVLDSAVWKDCDRRRFRLLNKLDVSSGYHR